MSEYTTEEILKLIEENGGPEGLDLSGKDLSGIDLDWRVIKIELEKARNEDPERTPAWFSEEIGGINIQGANLECANLQGAFLGYANLRQVLLTKANLQKADLLSAKLQGARLAEANFQEAFLAFADLQGADLSDVNLQGAILPSAKLQGSKLSRADLQKANLTGAKLHRAYLGYANLQETDLETATLLEANLVGTDLQRALLGHANLQGALLTEANLQEADLESTVLQGVTLWRANLKGAKLRYSHLEKVDFFRAESLEGVYFYHAFLDDTRMRREQLGGAIGEELEGKYDEAREAYLALKNNFAEIGRYRDESWAYVKERQMGKMMNHPRLARKYYGEELPENPGTWRLGWFYIRHTVNWAIDCDVEWTCSYGESVHRTLRAMGVVLVGFAVLYRLLGAIVDVSGNPSSSWLHCLLYSGGAFTTFGVDTLRPANDWIRALSILESAVGIALTGLLGFVLGNRIRRS